MTTIITLESKEETAKRREVERRHIEWTKELMEDALKSFKNNKLRETMFRLHAAIKHLDKAGVKEDIYPAKAFILKPGSIAEGIEA